MKLHAYAKLNLSLNVVGKRGNMHEIDSVMTSVDVFDEITLQSRNDKNVTVCGVDGVPDERNTAYRAAVRFVESFDVCGVDVQVVKHIPFGAGMGGSSADAAAVLYGMAVLNNIATDSTKLREIAVAVGSDVWYMTFGGYARVGGCGEEINRFAVKKPTYYALTTFDFPCNTAVVYGNYDEVGGETCDNELIVSCLSDGHPCKAYGKMRNGLQRAVTCMYDYAEQYMFFTKSRDYLPIMTGSGSAFFIPFEEYKSAAEACETLCRAGFKTTVCRDVPCGVDIVDEN